MRSISTRNGKTTVVEGWQSSLLSAALFVGVWLVFFPFIGATVTIGQLLLLLIPAFGVAALLASLFSRR